MSLIRNKCQDSLNKPDLHRRSFISTGVLGGLTLALTPGFEGSIAHASDNAPPGIFPTPADSLSLYMLLLDRLKSDILNPHFELLSCLSGEVTSRYALLQRDVAELERLVPELRSPERSSNLKSVTSVAYASASMMQTLATERVLLTNASFSLASLAPESLRVTANELEQRQGSLTLSPKAAALLRKILVQIHDLEKPSVGLEKSTHFIMELNKSLDGEGGKMPSIRQKLMSAILALVAGELNSGSAPTSTQTTAANNVKDAIEELKALDAYQPPKSLNEYVSGARSNRCKEARDALAAVTKEPTESLRRLLEGTVMWIEKGDQISQRGGADAQFVNASLRTPFVTPWFERWYAVRGVLDAHLPPATPLRTGACIALVVPLLWRFQGAQRVERISQQLVNIMPGGSSDRNATRRQTAAALLANL